PRQPSLQRPDAATDSEWRRAESKRGPRDYETRNDRQTVRVRPGRNVSASEISGLSRTPTRLVWFGPGARTGTKRAQFGHSESADKKITRQIRETGKDLEDTR